MKRKEQMYTLLLGLLFMVFLFSSPALVARAASQSITMTVGTSRSISENSYSEGSKTWTVSDPSIVSLMNAGSSTSRVIFANSVGSTTVIIKTVYTVTEPTYNSSLGIWVPTLTQKTSYFTYYVTVVEEQAPTPAEIVTIDDGTNLTISSKMNVVEGTIRDELSYQSSDPSVISVDGHGVLLAKKSGTATITITDEYGATMDVSVNAITQTQAGYTPISSIEELRTIPSGSSDSYYLTQDLDFTGYTDSFSITSFLGIFDGAGHKITGYQNNTALFQSASYATIKNLTMENARIDGNGSTIAAILCTGNACSISNCHVIGGSVQNTTNAGGIFTCDITSNTESGSICFCTNSASVTGREIAGGIAGHTSQTVLWCTNKGTIKTTNTESVKYGCAAGIVAFGLLDPSDSFSLISSYYHQNIRYCINEGDVQSVTAGGIAGRLYASIISQCCNKGNISSLPASLSSTRFASYGTLGGILGHRLIHYNGIYSCITNCYNQGDITAIDTRYPVNAGGIAGQLTLSEQYRDASIQNTYSLASVTHTKQNSDSYRGGIAGYVFLYTYCGFTVKNSYTNDSVPVGIYFKGSIGSSFNQTSCVETLSTPQQHIASCYTNFNFGNYWTIEQDGVTIPYLAFEDKAYHGLNLPSPVTEESEENPDNGGANPGNDNNGGANPGNDNGGTNPENGDNGGNNPGNGDNNPDNGNNDGTNPGNGDNSGTNPENGIPAPSTPSADTTQIGQLISSDDNHIYTVTGTADNQKTVSYAGALQQAATITIPDTITINGFVYQVTEIAPGAFSNNKRLTRVTIGNHVATIGNAAFSGCSKLKTIKLGNNVTSIGQKAFYKNTKLTSITIPSSVTTIGKQAFSGCKNLKTIKIKSGLLTGKTVGSKAFKGIHKKATIKVPKNKLANYKALLKKKGVGSKVKIKK